MSSYDALNDLSESIAEEVREKDATVTLILLANEEGQVSIRSHGIDPEMLATFLHELSHKIIDGSAEITRAPVELPEPVIASDAIGNLFPELPPFTD